MRALVPGADVALTNTGGLRSDLAEGPFTFGELYQLLPFDNQRVTVSLTGAQLRTVVKQNLEMAGSMVTLSGVSASAACDRGQLTVALRRESGGPIRDNESLTVVTTDFLATGGDSFFAPVVPVHVEPTAVCSATRSPRCSRARAALGRRTPLTAAAHSTARHPPPRLRCALIPDP